MIVFQKIITSSSEVMFKRVDELIKFNRDSKSLPDQLKAWQNVESIVKSIVGSLFHYLSTSNNEEIKRFIIKKMDLAYAYIACFPKIAKKLLKVI